LRRYKRRLRDYHARARQGGEEANETAAPAPFPEPEDEAMEAGDAPAVIAEISTEPPDLTVGEAALWMDRADLPVLLFRNRSHGELNLVYRRADGNIGWIDPRLDPARSPSAR
jgi:hypothetical protein